MKSIVVMPAYNAEKTLRQTLADIPAGSCDEIILVDDCSGDHTVKLAEELGLTVIRHDQNLGYGGNQKTCYQTALAHGCRHRGDVASRLSIRPASRAVSRRIVGRRHLRCDVGESDSHAA